MAISMALRPRQDTSGGGTGAMMSLRLKFIFYVSSVFQTTGDDEYLAEGWIASYEYIPSLSVGRMRK